MSMNYLSESGKFFSEMNYETDGRLCMKYSINSNNNSAEVNEDV